MFNNKPPAYIFVIAAIFDGIIIILIFTYCFQMEIKIKKFKHSYQKEVESMVFNGLNDTAKKYDNNVKAAIKNYLKRSLTEDLGSIYSHYNDKGIFYIALNESGEVVGSLGAEYINKNKSRLKRLSVKKSYRNIGIAKKLLKKVEDWAKNNNVNELVLGTSEIQEKAFSFWISNGFELVETDTTDIGIKLYSLKKELRP